MAEASSGRAITRVQLPSAPPHREVSDGRSSSSCTVGKGAAGIGGAYGRGVLFEHGRPTGQTSLTQVTIGAQLGGQAYSEIVFFESESAATSFKKGEFAMAAEVSAVVAATGASANAKYANGVAVFTLAKGGLMAEASVGGQKFGFRPFARAM